MHPKQILTRTNGRHAPADQHSSAADVIPAHEISGACVDHRDGRLVTGLTRDNDEGHAYSAGADHEC
jgi:hypothetical protein